MVSVFHFWSLNSGTELIDGIWDMYVYICKLEIDSRHLRNQPFPQQEEMNNSTAENYAPSNVRRHAGRLSQFPKITHHKLQRPVHRNVGKTRVNSLGVFLLC